MNIQIFGTTKSNDTKKAQRWFSERKIKFQFIDLREKSMSLGEFNNVRTAVGGYEKLIDENCKDKELLALLHCLTDGAKEEKMFEYQILLRNPIVRNGKQATVGYSPDVWKSWE